MRVVRARRSRVGRSGKKGCSGDVGGCEDISCVSGTYICGCVIWAIWDAFLGGRFGLMIGDLEMKYKGAAMVLWIVAFRLLDIDAFLSLILPFSPVSE